MNDGEPQIEKTVTFAASEEADKWAMERLRRSEHGWHGHGCQTCTGRYITLCHAFDEGYKVGFEDGWSEAVDNSDDE